MLARKKLIPTARTWALLSILIIAVVATMFLLGKERAESDPSSLHISGGCLANSHPILPGMARELVARISHCSQGDGDTTTLETNLFPPGTSHVNMAVAGYPASPGIELRAVTEQGIPLHVFRVNNVGDRWKELTLEVPRQIQGQPYRIQLVDNSQGFRGWSGLAFLNPASPWHVLRTFMPIAGIAIACHVWLLTWAWLLPLPPSVSPWRPVVSLIILGVTCWTAVIATLASSRNAVFINQALLALPFLLALLKLLLQRTSCHAKALGSCNRDLLPSLAFTLLITWIGLYPFDWTGNHWALPANRWTELPVDSWLPLIFADMLLSGEVRRPMEGDWLSSDRPPLQAGLQLLLNALPIEVGSGLRYQIGASWVQSLVLVPLFPLLAHVPEKRTQGLFVLAIAFSPIMIVNGLFVWPKLWAASYCAAYHLALFHSQPCAPPSRLSCVLAGTTASLALLSHGGALFVLIGSSLAYLLARKHSIARLVPIGIVAASIYAPWVLYQRLIDPPGNRLVKWHFAGVIPPTPESTFSTIMTAYERISLTEWLSSRADNVSLLYRGSLDFFFDLHRMIVRREGGMSEFISNSFHLHAYSAWLATPALGLAAAIVVLCLQRGRGNRAPLIEPGSWTTIFITAVVWCTLMFNGKSTVIHHGSYFFNILLMVLVMTIYYRISPRLIIGVCMTHALLLWLIYVPTNFSDDIPYRLGTFVLMMSTAMACLRFKPDMRPARLLQTSASPLPLANGQ